MNSDILNEIRDNIIKKNHINNLFLENESVEVYISKSSTNNYYMLIIPKNDNNIYELNESFIDYFTKYLDIKNTYISYKKDSIYIFF